MDTYRDYRLTGPEAAVATAKGLASAEWYQCPVPRSTMRELMQRSDARALADTVLWLGLLIGSGWYAHRTFGTWRCIPAFVLYGVLYGSAGDSRWHEGGHGTAFKTSWMNTFVYHLGSFMVTREPVSWRWSHARHHSDTLIVGRDPEIAAPRPTPVWKLVFAGTGIPAVWAEAKKYAHNVVGRVTAEEADYLPTTEWRKAFWAARIHVLIWVAAIAASLRFGTVEPLLFVGLPTFYGRWLSVVYGFTQHAGLAEDVLDHRLNCRTVRMNAVHRFLYWNMNYHVEHHMFPTVPYHQLPALHEAVKSDMPPPYSGIAAAYREIIPAVARQNREPGYYVRRPIPNRVAVSTDMPAPVDADTSRGGWVDVVAVDDVATEDVRRFDHGTATYAVYRLADGTFCATDGRCTHGRAHLADGFVSGTTIECPKHNGRFDLTTGEPCRGPVTIPVRRHRVDVRDGRVWLELPQDS